MKLVIDIPEGIYNTAVKGGYVYSMDESKVINAIANGKLLTKNEYICEEVRITNSKGEKLDALLDKARMTFWCTWVSAEFAQKVLGWKMEGTDADSN